MRSLLPDHPPIKADPINVHPPDTPPDAVGIFARLVEARRRRDTSAVGELQQALRRAGWQIMAIAPAGAGGGRQR